MFARRTDWNPTPNPLVARLAQRTRPYLDLTESNPTRCGFTYDESRILRALGTSKALQYRPDARGLLSAREAVCDYYRQRGLVVGPDHILLTASTSEAYSHLFRLLCNSGDRIHVPQPSYPLFELLATLNDVVLTPYPLFYDHGWHIELAALAGQLDARSRALLVVSPNNPTGSYVRTAEWLELQRLAREHDAAIILDEVFFDYTLSESAERVQDFIGPGEALTFALNGLSKIAALPQMKLGWIVVSGAEAVTRAALERLEIINDTFLSADAPVQCAAAELLDTRHAIQPQIRQRLGANLAACDRLIGSEAWGMLSRLEVEGGWYVVLRVPTVHSDQQWAELLLEQADLYIHPGHFYDFAREGFLVASLITPETTFAEGLQRLSVAVGTK
jgi:aspartate/methionine/tyrosine aminotransferase